MIVHLFQIQLNSMTVTIIKSVCSIIEILIAVIGFSIGVKEYYKNKRSKASRRFVEQITAYYAEEQEAIKWINELSKERIPNLQTKLRKRAEENENNPARYYPNMTPKQAESYLC